MMNRFLKVLFTSFLIMSVCLLSHAQPERTYVVPEVVPQEDVEVRVFPPSWWTGMVMDTIELIFHADDIRDAELGMYQSGIEILSVDTVENPNYLFAKVHINENAPAGNYTFSLLKEGDMMIPVPFEIQGRKTHQPDPLTPADILYLIMPDRFANGNIVNDRVPDFNEQKIDRADVFERHGGDLQGIMDHLDYLEDLGISSLWLNPVQENDQFHESYHGYAITDHYKIDPRLGSNELYRQLVDSCHRRGIKMIMDVVLNHCGDQHDFIRDLPEKNWIHRFPEFTRSNFRATTLMDPYAAESDKDQMVQGWFDVHMPDLDQRNERVSRFLIQNSIWWVEYAGLDGYRIDTYPYSYIDFSNEWVSAVLREYPGITLFGETWVHNIPIQAFFSEKEHLFKNGSIVPSLTDFQMHFALVKALTEEPGWTEGISKIYYTLAQDFMYQNPEKHVIFLDNHDLNRIWSVIERDFSKYEMGLTLLLTTRGLPMIYYGTEILLQGRGGAFGEHGRIDFPGGWKDDKVNKFIKEGRTPTEAKAFSFLQRLIRLRKEHPALSEGELVQYIPQQGLYVYFRIKGEERFMVIANTSKDTRTLHLHDYQEGLAGHSSGYDHISEREVDLKDLKINPGQILLLEL